MLVADSDKPEFKISQFRVLGLSNLQSDTNVRCNHNTMLVSSN